MTETPLTCAEVRDLLEEHRRGTLSADLARAVDAHLAGCPACPRLRDAEERTIALVAALPRPEAPAALRRHVQGLAGRRRLRRWLGHPAVAGLGAAAAVILVLLPALDLTRLGLRRPIDPERVVERLLESGVAEHRSIVLQIQAAPPAAPDPGPLFDQVRAVTDIQLPPVLAGGGDFRLLTARPAWLADRKAAAAALRYPTSPVTTYFLLRGPDLPMPDRNRVQIDRYRPYMRQVGEFQCIYWKQGELAYLIVSGLDAEHTRQLYLEMRRTL